MQTPQEEARRLTANWLNIMAAGVISVGVFAPLATLLLDSSSGWSAHSVAGVSLGFLALGTGLHLSARALMFRG
jgi:hypothetical protein